VELVDGGSDVVELVTTDEDVLGSVVVTGCVVLVDDIVLDVVLDVDVVLVVGVVVVDVDVVVSSVVVTTVQSPWPVSVCWNPLSQTADTVNDVPEKATVVDPPGPIVPE
jgi:hypothetical protein